MKLPLSEGGGGGHGDRSTQGGGALTQVDKDGVRSEEEEEERTFRELHRFV